MFVNSQIETERLHIRPYRIHDASALYELQKQPEVNFYIPEPIYSLKEIEDIIYWSIEMNKKNSKNHIAKFNLSIIEKSSQKLIGYCGLGPSDFEPTSTELYYALSRDIWEKGYATEATSALLQYGFSVIGLEMIIASVFPENQKSIHVLEKLGFQFKETVQNLEETLKEYEGMLYFHITRELFLQKAVLK
ncbi:GNAT family N-acetyltransferase [Bacillus pseudomycoides]|uniref:GNAT family N-acetyltransferase n=1 Tax=Bacillus pseudomycoides TaxID=64104 RepID=UPI000BEC7576|nr:GNAT family N-acetyltransferase [Bacillus pseudomycoides]PED71510.1 GNAT family N-acetyltransferase [Bacillus pseudomycoides]PEI47200.1 GNAT family N-acetyltransferase [Bacillus pseudomycoides]PEJ77161.1 GNAT family N-acetyltransferase [Bacillus pseudomycoides]PEM10171.1 GNAT family N-acetyltransferase [Bacillus pseudomycoides]PEP00359.1 GNAT family N-acetyltransferase [Bacillus pseudomycoides]